MISRVVRSCVLDLLVPILRSSAARRDHLCSRLWGLRLEAEVRYAGGKLIRAGNVIFQHSVSFSGQGTLVIGRNVTLGYWQAGSRGNPIVLQPRLPESEIVIGAETYIVNGCEFFAMTSIRIGSKCLIGPRCTIMDSDFHGLSPDERGTPGRTVPIVVEENVWLGSDVTVLKGVHIGRDSVLGAHCVVTKSVPAGSIVAGNPMQIIGSVYQS